MPTNIPALTEFTGTLADDDVLVLIDTSAASDPKDRKIQASHLRYQLVRAVTSASDPTVNDDSTAGYSVGNFWLNTTDDGLFVCTDTTVGAAVWDEFGTGVTAFTGLSDTPASYSGQASKVVAVNAGETALEFVSTGSGDVTGPASSTAGNFPDFDDTTGKVIGDSGYGPSSFATAAQGALADTAVQPGDDAADLGSGAATDGYVLTSDGAGGAAWEAVPGAAPPDWGDIGGTLSSQTDLQSALDAKLAKLATINSFAGNHTLDSSDSGAYVRITAAGTVTLPDSMSTGFQCVIVNATDAATVALSAATTLTIPSGFDAEVVNRRAVTVIHVGSNVWEAHGALVETP